MMFSTSWLKNSVPSVSSFTAVTGRPVRATSVSCSHLETSCGRIVRKNPAKTARRRAGFLTHLFDGFHSGREGVENFIRDRCADDERGRVGKAKLLQAFGRDLFFPVSFLRHGCFGFLGL